jgi:hypothetical protein
MSSAGSDGSETSGISGDSSNYRLDASDSVINFDVFNDDDDDTTSDDDGSVASQLNKNDLRAPMVEEAKQLGYMRCLVLVLLLLTAVLVSTGTYVALNAQEVSSVSHQYTLYTGTIQDASEFHQFSISEALGDMVDSITAYAGQSNQTFPYVTLEKEFEVMGRHALQGAGADVVFFMPLVTDVAAWNNYSLRKDWWSESVSIATRASWTPHPDLFKDNGRLPLHGRNESKGDAPIAGNDDVVHMPLWMVSPPPFATQGINLDMMSFPWMQRIAPSLTLLDEGESLHC